MRKNSGIFNTLMQFAGAVGTSVCAALVAAGSTHGFIFLLILAVVCLILQIVGFKNMNRQKNSKNERHEFYQEFMPLVIIKHSVSVACQNDSAEHELLPDSRME